METTHIAVDTSKSVFTLHASDPTGRCTYRRDLSRSKFLAWFAKLAPLIVTLEACGGSHHWGRELSKLGHTVRLIAAQHAKPFVKRGKNDRADAEAISEAASRPSMRFVPVKNCQSQAQAMVLKRRTLLVGQRTQLVNALRGHATEFGLVVPRGTENVVPLLAKIAADEAMPTLARELCAELGDDIVRVDERITAIDRRIAAMHKSNPISQLLTTIPGVGPIAANTFATTIDPTPFTSGRAFAAYLGLTPKDHSSGGKQRLGGISRSGDERLRELLVLGAMSVLSHAVRGKPARGANAWVMKLLERKPRKVVAVALANKMARIVWAMMSSGEVYRGVARPAAA
jgi:transposase